MPYSSFSYLGGVPFHYVPFVPFGLLFPISQPQLLSTLTTFGVTATVRGTLTKMKDLCMAYASASCVHIPVLLGQYLCSVIATDRKQVLMSTD